MKIIHALVMPHGITNHSENERPSCRWSKVVTSILVHNNTYVCLAAGVNKLPSTNKMIESIKMKDLGLIRDVSNPLDR